MSAFREHILPYFLPASCLACKSVFPYGQEREFCDACQEGIRSWGDRICRACGDDLNNPDLEASLCGECLRDPPPFEWARSIYRLDPSLLKILHAFKYSGDEAALPWMLDRLDTFLRQHFPELRCDFVLPVPLHWRRLLRRGYNQSLLLARGLAERRGEALSIGHLLKSKATQAQSKLSREERRQQIRGAFCLKKSEDLKDKRILLVDDIHTTGSTLRECSRILAEVGAKVHALSFARTPLEFD